MKRREFITLVGGAAVARACLCPIATQAQEQEAKVYTIGVLAVTSLNPDVLLKALREGLRHAGYMEGLRGRIWPDG